MPLPRPMRQLAEGALTVLESTRDSLDHLRFGAPSDQAVGPRVRGTNRQAQLTKDYHRIEKGLTFAAPKRPFGDVVRRRLTDLAGTGPADPLTAEGGPVPTAIAALEDWNSRGVVDSQVAPEGPVMKPLPTESSDALFYNRHSIRNFDPARAVDVSTIRQALDYARHTPSVCNRQAAKAWLFDERSVIDRVLKIQGGSRGFAETIPNIAVITVERGLFAGPGERNQRWIDGGLFAMSLVWAFQSLGVGTCMLNWSKRHRHTAALRNLVGIPDSEDVICVVAFGYPPETGYRVARSPRRALDEVATGLPSADGSSTAE